MKKFFTILTVFGTLLTTATLTSCEDAEIARTLEGTWSGDMRVRTGYGGRDYYATYTEITFLRDPGRYSSGNGYWVDYYSDAPWDYVANHIDWTVDYGDIKIYFREDNTSFTIRDYSLNDDRFSGTLWDNDNRVTFSLYHISSPNWNSYDHWGYSSWSHYYSRGTSSDTSDTEKPVRRIGD